MNLQTKSKIRSQKIYLGGVYTALVTPFKNGRVDLKSLGRIINHQIANGVSGFVVNGTTAESPNLDEAEVKRIYRFVVKKTKGLVPIILGTGSNSTAQTIANTKRAERWGADAALVVVPYYNKPTQRGMYEHFKAVAESTKIQIILYNVPGRTVVSLNEETVSKLSKIKNVIGIKEASGQMKLFEAMKKRVRKKFIWFSGDDQSTPEFIARGGDGVISVVSHVIPKELSEVVDAIKTQRKVNRKFVSKYARLNKFLGIESNPIPVKMMLNQMQIISGPELRLPLVKLSPANSKKVKAELTRLGVL